jgi:excisionase family DNA binding protein
MGEKLLNIRQAAEVLGVSIDTLRRWDKSGKLPAVRKNGGTHRYYREQDLDVFKSDLFGIAINWAMNKKEFPNIFYCPISSVFQARLVRMEQELKSLPGFSRLYSLIVLVAGEIGDNSFAHNLGKWPDVPGIFFGYDLRKKTIVLADRGVGVLETLRRVRPNLKNNADALYVAFTEFISGRAPEKRGNGLKLVREVVENNPIDLLFISGDAEIRMEEADKNFVVRTSQNVVRGCLAKIEFKAKSK